MKIPTCLLVISTFFVTPLFQAQASDSNSPIKKRSLDNEEAYEPPKKRRKISKSSQSKTQYQNQQQAHNHSSNSTDCCNENALVLEKNAKKEDNNQSSAHDSSHESHSSDEEEDFDIAYNTNDKEDRSKERAMIEHLSFEEKVKKFFHQHCWDEALKNLRGRELTLVNCVLCTDYGMEALTDEYFRYALPLFFLSAPCGNRSYLVELMCYNRCEDVKTLLRNSKVGINVLNYVDEYEDGETPLAYAIKMNKQDIVKLLLEYPGIALKSQCGEASPLEVAIKQVVEVYQKNRSIENFDIYQHGSMHIFRLVHEKTCIFDMSDELKAQGCIHLGELPSKMLFHSVQEKRFYDRLSEIIIEKESKKIVKNLQACQLVKDSNAPDGVLGIIANYALAVSSFSN